MESYKLVLPEHMSHYGYLFGGYLLKWVDEMAWISASTDYPGCNFVTVAMDKVEFRKTVREGAILRFDVKRQKVGNTSVQYSVNVLSRDIESSDNVTIFSTNITFVRIDENSQKLRLPE
jgi:acyl-CoA hydrolase